MSEQYIEKTWREVNSRTDAKGDKFSQGVKDFKWSIGQGYGFIPNQSYFRITLKLTNRNGPPIAADGLAFADNVCGNLFNNIYFNMGGQTVSQITNGVPQIDILKSRLTKNPLYNSSLGVATGLAGHHYDRRKLLFPPPSRTTPTDANDLNLESKQKDINTQGRNTRDFIWQPGLGIFDCAVPLGAGEYELVMNPSQDYKLACIDTGTENWGKIATDLGIGEGKVNLEVVDIRFYVCMCRVDLKSSGEEILDLKEWEVLNANIRKGESVTLNEEFTVPSSTESIAMFIQDPQSGKETSVPPSRFHNRYFEGDEDPEGTGSRVKEALGLRDYQIEYGNMTKPTIRLDSRFTPTDQLMFQRYVQSSLESGQFFELTGTETFEEWCERGPIFYETFMKSADNLATRLHVVANFGPMINDSRLLVVACYNRTIKITRQNGLIVQVVAENK